MFKLQRTLSKFWLRAYLHFSEERAHKLLDIKGVVDHKKIKVKMFMILRYAQNKLPTKEQ